jgi:hypothetical protein
MCYGEQDAIILIRGRFNALNRGRIAKVFTRALS